MSCLTDSNQFVYIELRAIININNYKFAQINENLNQRFRFKRWAKFEICRESNPIPIGDPLIIDKDIKL